MTREIPVITGASELVISGELQAFLVVQVEGIAGTRVLEVADGVAITVGEHARIVRRGGATEIEDLPSRVTTYVNGERVIAPRRLEPGDAIAIGPVVAIAGIAQARHPKRHTIDSVIAQVLVPQAPSTAEPHAAVAQVGDMRTQLGEIERAAIVAALDAAGGNQTRAAFRLGMSRRTLIYRMEKYGLKPVPTKR